MKKNWPSCRVYKRLSSILQYWPYRKQKDGTPSTLMHVFAQIAYILLQKRNDNAEKPSRYWSKLLVDQYSYLDLTHREFLAVTWEILLLCRTAKVPNLQFELTIMCKNGSSTWCSRIRFCARWSAQTVNFTNSQDDVSVLPSTTLT